LQQQQSSSSRLCVEAQTQVEMAEGGSGIHAAIFALLRDASWLAFLGQARLVAF
jgi:hypothetical protein